MHLPFPIGEARPTAEAWQRTLLLPWRALVARWRWVLGSGVACIFMLFCLQPWDEAWLQSLMLAPESPAYPWAKHISGFGEFQWFNLGLALLFWLPGWALRRVRWRTYGWAVFYASVLAGIAINLVRPLTGRARPSTGVEDAWYGPVKGLPLGEGTGHAYQAFPSGHTATAFAAASACLVLSPPVGVPVLVAAGGVSWSRLALNRHHPTDILGGMAVGMLCGLAVAGPLRSRNQGEERSRT